MVSGYPGYEYSEYIVYAYYGSGTAIMSGYVTLNVGDVWTLVCIGSTISVLQNGTVVNSVTDTTFSSGIYAALGISPPSASLSNLQVSNFSIGSATSGATVSGNCGISGATISWTGTSSGSVISGAGGAYTTSALSNGSYTITPSKTGYTFSPASAAETVSGSNITGVNFTASAVAAVWSQPDDRDYAIFPNNEITVQGTEQYTIPAHPSHTTPVDSRKAKPVDSRKAANIPENSRNNPAGHE
jgi:hypothetical protein